MKRLALLLTLMPACLTAQEIDSARFLMDRCAAMFNYNALPLDSTLVMETTITYLETTDTFLMRRWYAAPGMYRVEVWRGDTLTTGYCTNGINRFREYSPRNDWWADLDSIEFSRRIEAYDFRGLVRRWQDAETQFIYAGTTTLKGQPLAVVRAERQNLYTRYFLFEVNSGLLLFIIETDEMPAGSRVMNYGHSDWKAFHEYIPIGACLLPSEESYLRDNLLTIMRTTAHFEPRDNMFFNRDTHQ